MEQRYVSGRRTRQRGLVLLDVLVAVFILALIASGVFALLPSITRSQEMSDDQDKAAQMADRMIEQLQQLNTAELTPTVLTTMKLIDTGQTTSPFSFNNVPLDYATGYSPSKVLRGATAKFWLVPIDANSVRVDLEIGWTSASGKTCVHKSGTVVGGYR